MPPATRTLAAGPCEGAAVLLTARGLAAEPCSRAVRRTGVRHLLPILALTALLSACAGSPGAAGGGDTGADADAPAGGGISRAENDLVVEVDPGDGSPLESWSLTCAGAVSGTHPDAEAACAHLAGLEDPFAPLPADVACTEIYGGPQSAHVAGLWGGEPVDIELSRVDGCRITQWDALGPLLPTAIGVDATE